jgi:hypothetical protein
MFIYPMWNHESQRIGKRQCTPLGSRLHLVAEMIGFTCLLLIPCIVIYLAYRGLSGTFQPRLWWLLAAPFVGALIGDVIYAYSWRLASQRGFEYDEDKCVASWDDNGKRVTYRYETGPRDSGEPDDARADWKWFDD